MYKCEDCGALFPSPSIYCESNTVPYGEGYACETVNIGVCPECFGDSVTEVLTGECRCCGFVFEAAELDTDGLCNVCREDKIKENNELCVR